MTTVVGLPLAFGGTNILEQLDVAIEIGLVGLLVPFIAGIVGPPRGERPGLVAITCGMPLRLTHRTLNDAVPA